MKDRFAGLRLKMVENQIASRGVKDRRLLEVLRRLPRHLFVPEDRRPEAYEDEPLSIGEGQTISQPYIVAFMTEALNLHGPERILEIGTGSGYQTAVLAELAAEVFSVEVLEALSRRARNVLAGLGYENIRFKVGDGHQGWAESAPYDGIIVTAAADEVPAALPRQLKDGGRMILPVGTATQELVLVVREGEVFHRSELLPVRFVPLVTVH
ncbi:MAG: protein-L-isoaspartate O-methyltransferase [Candidatus Aminicenantes bacterium RBG_13_63_10]|nr:MAG: protein-L-isoaspartate O-methyltransferase [Candidatus Aminicenantes bacterium RBG_13_63_10]